VHNGQALLPMMELIEQSRMAIDELIDVMGRASIEAVLQLSAVQVAGAPQQGKARQAEIVWHGTQRGRVYLKERKLRVNKPRLRKKGRGANKEIEVPAYEAMQQDTVTGERMLEILLNGVSTRRYSRVIPEMANTEGVSRSTVSRESIEAPARAARADGIADARRLEDEPEGGHGQVSPDRRLAGARLSRDRGGAAGGIGGLLHHQSARYSMLPASLSGHQQRRRQSAFWSSRA